MKKILLFSLLFIIGFNLQIPSVLAVICGGKIVVETTEGFGDQYAYPANLDSKDKYEKGWKKVDCPITPAKLSPPTPEIIGKCTTTYEKDCTPELYSQSKITTCQPMYFICGTSGADILKNYSRVLYLWGVSICGIIAVFLIVLSGVQITTAGGDSAKVDEAKNRIMQSLSGLVILLLSALILYTINPTFFIK